MKYVYFGTSAFAAIILERLLEKKIAPVAVVSQPDREAGRGQKKTGSPVSIIARMHTLRLHQPEKLDAAFLMDMRVYEPDLFIVAAYGKIIPKTILDFPPYKTINVHPSLLPLYRGPSPIQTALLNGETKTGVTIMVLDDQIDHGPLLAKESAPISAQDTTETLTQNLALLGANMLEHVIPRWMTHVLKPVEQDHTQATFSRIFTKDDGHIDWAQSAESIERHVRAMTPWPGSWTLFGDVTLKIKKASVIHTSSDQKPGTVLEFKNDHLMVVCGGSILGIERLQPAGKKDMSAKDFVNGNATIISSPLT